ncbi:uncharacterized protein LOC136074366 [Hydra vulgaris]|uniref:Uncharacterized protein LOC136074366 n=1 Tax=Hydra vulgaris TaxID=6087 RepID=A0ABM4B1S4_HYDVU
MSKINTKDIKIKKLTPLRSKIEGKSAPIILELESKACRNLMLKNAYNNKDKINGIYFNVDMTEAESCRYTNATSLNNKFDLFLLDIASFKPDIYMITETWFNENSVTNVNGYQIIHNNRSNSRSVKTHGDGVAIYVKESFLVYSPNDSFTKNNDIEHIWCILSIKDEQILLGCIYRPPDASEEINNCICKIIEAAKNKIDHNRYSGLLISGDFNYPNIIWKKNNVQNMKKYDKYSTKFVEYINDNYLHQAVISPKYNADLINGNILDLILTEKPERINKIHHNPTLGNTRNGHQILNWKYFVKNTVKNEMSNFGKSGFNYKLGNYTVIKLLMKMIGKPKPWIDREAKKAIRNKTSLWHKLLSNGFKCEKLKVQYFLINKTIKNLVKSKRINYEKKIAKSSKENPKLFYAYVNSNRKIKLGINIITDKNCSLQTNRDNIANILNENFHSVFVIEDPTNFPNITVKTSKILELDIDSVITQDIVRNKLSELNVNKALEADGVSSYVLKKCQNSFCKPLKLLFKRSLKEEQIPLIWKMANCRIMQIGFKNPCITYSMFDAEIQQNNILATSKVERDLGVMMQSNLKWTSHIDNGVGKSNQMLALIKQTFKYFDSNMANKIYTTFVRPHLEFTIQVWCPYLKQDILKLEKVQRRATKLVPAFKKMPYEKRLQLLKLTALEERRLRGYLIFQYKIQNAYEEINWINDSISKVQLKPYNFRSHNQKLTKAYCKSNARYNFFSCRVVNAWNGLPPHIVESITIDQFKNNLNKSDYCKNYLLNTK